MTANCTYADGRRCKILTVSECPAKCSFYQTEEQAKASQQRANARLRSLLQGYQQMIANKYYGGTMPWKN